MARDDDLLRGMAKPDVFDSFQGHIEARAHGSPWRTEADGRRRYVPDLQLLETVLSIPVREERKQESGRVAKAIDAWCAFELRRAGFDADEVWPRLTRPRVLPRDIAVLLDGLPKNLADDVRSRIAKSGKAAKATPSEAYVLGRVFLKQADVLVAQWARGAEVLVSTKSMLSSYGNNLRNRFEESYGDAKNLRGRFPLVSMGFLYLLRSNILAEPANWELAKDMIRKLREETDVYDATALVLAEWVDGAEFNGVRLREDDVPPELRLDQFLETIISGVLTRTPVQLHVQVRELRDARDLPVEEGEGLTPIEDEDSVT